MAEIIASHAEAHDDEEYDEEQDEDFNPESAAADEDASSSSDDEESVAKPVKKARKRKSDAIDGDLDSGDEATIQERERKRKKKDADAGEDSGGEGGLIKTRAQRNAEKAERKEKKRTTIGEVTIDVASIWEELNSVPIGRPPPPPPKVTEAHEDDEQDKENVAEPQEFITIKRRIEFAGEITEVEETVLRSSKEAQQYLSDSANQANPNHATRSDLRRPLKRPSLFEPNPTATVKGVPPERLRPRAPSRLDVLLAEKRAEDERKKKAEKMTTVQKSALDWKGFVQQQGIGQELDEYGKSKMGYLERESFLGRADLAREEAARAARLKG